MKKMIKKAIITFMMFILLSTFPVFLASATDVRKFTDSQQQATTSWCGIASAWNAVRWEYGSPRSQWDAAAAFGIPTYSGVDTTQVSNIAEYMSYYTESYSPYLFSVTYNIIFNEIVYYDNMVICGAGKYTQNGQRLGHVMTIYGINNNNGNYLYYIDPWYSFDPSPIHGVNPYPNGLLAQDANIRRQYCSYSAFCNGSYNSYSFDCTVLNDE